MKRDTLEPYEPSSDFYIDTGSYKQPLRNNYKQGKSHSGAPSTPASVDQEARNKMIDKALDQVQDNKDKEALIMELASDLMTGKEIAYIDHDFKPKRLDIFTVVERFEQMYDGHKFPFIQEALATLFGSNGEESAQIINYGYKAAESLINEFYDSIKTIREENEDEID